MVPEHDSLPLSLRRTRRQNQALPLRFRDMLPEPPMPLPPSDTEAGRCTLAEPLTSTTSLSPAESDSESPLVLNAVPSPRPIFRTQANSFSLSRLYDAETLPHYDPASNLSHRNPPRSAEHATLDRSSHHDNPFHPYPNENCLRLGDWYWNHGPQLSNKSFNKLLQIVGSSDFRSEDIRDTNWKAIDRELGKLDAPDSEEWLDDAAGWKCVTVTISVPFSRRSLHHSLKEYSTEFYCRSLVSIIREKVLDPAHHEFFHYEPYELCWHPPHGSRDIRVHRELFTSKAFLEAHLDLQESLPEPGCNLPRRIVALMFWSDATQLTTFGDAKLWPVYVFFGNESKYERGQPSAHLCIHGAYLQAVRSLL